VLQLIKVVFKAPSRSRLPQATTWVFNNAAVKRDRQ